MWSPFSITTSRQKSGLPDAINRKLLSPFQYFGITDSVDFSQIRWQRGGYDVGELENLVTGNDVRAHLVIDKIREILLNVSSARGLGFCVSIRHAEYMASVFNSAGIPAVALSAELPWRVAAICAAKIGEPRDEFYLCSGSV